jgi:hypothetical protein
MVKVGMLCAAALLAVGVAQAAPTLYYTEDWNGAPGLGGGTELWQHDANGSASYIGWAGSYLRITLPEDDPPVGVVTYANSGSSGGNFAGNANYAIDYGLTLNFKVMAEDYAPSSMAIYFGNDDSGRVWGHSFASMPTAGAGFVGYSLLMNNFSDWALQSGVGNTGTDFLLDLSSVDWIGLRLVRSGLSTDQQDFGIDDFVLVVPEPETVALLLAVALSMVVTFRGKLAELVARIRA